MVKAGKTLLRVLAGRADANIAFGDLTHLLSVLGFESRMKGSHHTFWREGVTEILNRQDRDGKAKPCQVRQVREVIVKNRLGEDIDE